MSVAFYVHSDSKGQVRVNGIIQHLFGIDLVVFGSDLHWLQPMEGLELREITPLDATFEKFYDEQLSYLHDAPVGSQVIRSRVLEFVMALNDLDVRLCVVEDSVEIAMLSRLSSVAYIYVKQHGRRDDIAHLNAYEGALALIAAYPESWEHPDVPQWVRQKTLYTGGYSRFADFHMDQAEARLACGYEDGYEHVVVIWDNEEDKDLFLDRFVSYARYSAEYYWHVIGDFGMPVHAQSNLRFYGYLENPYACMRGADYVVGSAGYNTVMELADIMAKYVCIPQDRPFDEQVAYAELLSNKNAAVVLYDWPHPSDWKEIFDEVKFTDTSVLHSLIGKDATKKMADFIRKFEAYSHHHYLGQSMRHD